MEEARETSLKRDRAREEGDPRRARERFSVASREVGKMRSDGHRDVDGRVVVEGKQETRPLVQRFGGVHGAHHPRGRFNLCGVAGEKRRSVHHGDGVHRLCGAGAVWFCDSHHLVEGCVRARW